MAEALPGSKELVFHTALEGAQFLMEIPVNAKDSPEQVATEAQSVGASKGEQC